MWSEENNKFSFFFLSCTPTKATATNRNDDDDDGGYGRATPGLNWIVNKVSKTMYIFFIKS